MCQRMNDSCVHFRITSLSLFIVGAKRGKRQAGQEVCNQARLFLRGELISGLLNFEERSHSENFYHRTGLFK